jgi:hypothetical protein
MTDEIKKALGEWDEYLAMLEYEYRQRRPKTAFDPARREAKKVVNEVYPGIAALLAAAIQSPSSPAGRAGHSLTVRLAKFWTGIKSEKTQAKSTKAVATEVGMRPFPAFTNGSLPVRVETAEPEPLPNGKPRQKPGIVLKADGNSNLAETVLMMVRAADLAAGDVFHMGNPAALNALIGCARGSIANVLFNKARNTTMSDAGYEFQPLERGAHEYVEGCFSVQCVRAPWSATKQREVEALRAAIAAAEVEKAQAEARLRELTGR